MRILDRVSLALLALAITATHPAFAAVERDATATYRVRVVAAEPLRIEVEATLPTTSDLLAMSTTRPGDIPQLDAGGWPALVTGLTVSDANGQPVVATSIGAAGWRIATPAPGPVTVRYAVDYAPLAKLGWPAPRESVYADADNVVLAGRAVFVSAPGQRASHVAMEMPVGWHVAAPWQRAAGSRNAFRVPTVHDLVDNLFALTRAPARRTVSGRFDVGIVAIGSWRAVLADVTHIVDPAMKMYSRMMPVADDQSFLLVLLPQRERGGESFPNSVAMNHDEVPTRANRAAWGHTLAHEIFHYWNGWRMRGDDYAATQWFQEGFTEYMANKSLLSAGRITRDEFLRRLAKHIDDAGRLATPLDAPGTRKGPPLYGAGALVAFCWDVRIRAATHGEQDLRDAFTALWRRTGNGATNYDWDMIRSTLEGDGGDWDDFHARFIGAQAMPPVDDALHELGLRRQETLEPDGPVRIVPDPSASLAARRAWSEFAAR